VIYACHSAVAVWRGGWHQLPSTFPRSPGIIPVVLSVTSFRPLRCDKQQPRSPPACYGVKHREPNCGALRPPAPRTSFSPTPGSMHADTPPTLFGPESDPRDDLSLARNGCASQRLHSGVNVPGLPLRISNRFLSGPFGLSAPRPWLVSPTQDRFNASSPFPALHRSAPAFSTPPLPFGTVTSLRLNVFNAGPACGPAYRLRPIPFRSPMPFSFG
jgi:hypothetical protein